MAEIPVHKKGGIPWWVWLLLAILLAALLWFLFARDDNDADRVAAPVETTQPVDTMVTDNTMVGTDATGPITTLAALTAAPMATMQGRQVNLTGVPVGEVTADEGFYIGETAPNRAYVVFNETPTPGTAQEGNYDVNADSIVNLTGTVRPASEAPAGKTIPAGVDSFIYADTLAVTN